MAETDRLLLVYRTLFLAGETIRLVKLALDGTPPPHEEMELRDRLSDLQTWKDGLISLRDALEAGKSFTPPPASLMAQVRTLISQVEQARLAGAAAGASIALAGNALEVAMKVMSGAIG